MYTIHRFTYPMLVVLVIGCSGNDDSVIEASGTIEGTDVRVASEVAGRIQEIRVEEGSTVEKGDTLLIIDDREYRIQLRQAIANEEVAAAQYRLALEGSRKEDVLQAEAAFKSAESDYNRMKDLLATHTVTQKQYDDAYARYVAAQQTYEKLVRGLRQQEIHAARARRDQAAAQTELPQKRVRDCSILAPRNGTVTLKAVEAGEFVTVGANLLRITALDKVNLTIYVAEADLAHVKVGQHAAVRIDGAGEKEFRGTVTYISPNAEFTPKNVQTKEERTKLVFGVKIQIDNTDRILKPGLPADARLAIKGSAHE